MAEIATIDGAGRLVVPKPIRERLHLRSGSRLRIYEEGHHLVLEPIEEEALAGEEEGLLVVRGRIVGPLPDHRAFRDQRTHDLIKGRG